MPNPNDFDYIDGPQREEKELTCKCGHFRSEHALQDGIPRECLTCKDCLQFKDNSTKMTKRSEACEWDSHEFCEDLECQCNCHLVSQLNMERQ